jgi:ribose transport system substrate-binding protein
VEDPFYRAIGAGAAKAAEEHGLRYSETEYPELWAAEAQREILTDLDLSDADALLVGPVSTVALDGELQAIAETGIPIITVDTYVGDGDYSTGEDDYALSFVGTDNYNGGKEVAERLAELVGKEGSVYVNTTHSDVSSVSNRVEGFIAGMAEFPNMHVIATEYNQDRQSVAYSQTLRILREYPDVRAVFATNLFSSQGAYQAVLDSGLTGAVRIASWDSTEPIVEALERGFVDLVLAQSPREIGAKAVSLAIDHLEGRSVPRRVHVGAQILTLESVEGVDIEELTY